MGMSLLYWSLTQSLPMPNRKARLQIFMYWVLMAFLVASLISSESRAAKLFSSKRDLTCEMQ